VSTHTKKVRKKVKKIKPIISLMDGVVGEVGYFAFYFSHEQLIKSGWDLLETPFEIKITPLNTKRRRK